MTRPPITIGKWSAFIPRLRTNPSSENRLLVVHPDGERVIADCSVGWKNRHGEISQEEREANTVALASLPILLEKLERISQRFSGDMPTSTCLDLDRNDAREALAAAGYKF